MRSTLCSTNRLLPMLALSLGVLVASTPSLTLAGTGALNQEDAGQGSGLAVASAKQQFEKPKNRGIPGRRAPGGTRGDLCVAGEQQPLMALVPASNLATTVAEYPTLFFFVPETLAKSVSLELYEVNTVNNTNQPQLVYETTLPAPKGPGVISLTLPKSAGLKPLTPGKTYIYWFALNCPPELNPDKKPSQISVLGNIQRVPLSSSLAERIRTAKPSDLPSIYGENGIWLDLLASLAQLRQAQPEDPSLAQDWSSLMNGKTIQLTKYADAPLLPCCTLTSKRSVRLRK